MQVRKTNYEVNATPTFQVLTEDEIEAIYFSALTVLYETGVRVYDEEGVQVAYEGGAIVEDQQADNALVKIPPWLVDKALATLLPDELTFEDGAIIACAGGTERRQRTARQATQRAEHETDHRVLEQAQPAEVEQQVARGEEQILLIVHQYHRLRSFRHVALASLNRRPPPAGARPPRCPRR